MKFMKSVQLGGVAAVATVGLFALFPLAAGCVKKFRRGQVTAEEEVQDIPQDDPTPESSRLIHLDDETAVQLTAVGHTDDIRFAQIFQHAWQRVPSVETAVILAYWEKQRENSDHAIPQIELLSDPPFVTEHDNFLNHGCRLKFSADEVKNSPDDAVEVLIARELIQVSLLGKGMDTIKEDEDDVMDQMLLNWHFDPTLLRG